MKTCEATLNFRTTQPLRYAVRCRVLLRVYTQDVTRYKHREICSNGRLKQDIVFARYLGSLKNSTVTRCCLFLAYYRVNFT